MTKRVLLVAALATIVAVSAAFTSAPSRLDANVDTKLEQYMKEINKTMRKLRGALKDPANNAASIADVRAVQALTIKSRDETPALTGDQKEEDRAEFVAEYQRQMVEFTRSLLDLEVSLIDGDNEAAQKQLADMNGAKSEAHKRFKGGDKDKEGGDGEAPAGRRRGGE